jgi:hypothetical protein
MQSLKNNIFIKKLKKMHFEELFNKRIKKKKR